MNRRQKIIVSVVGIFVILLALLGLTYAYFLTRIHGNTNDKSVDITTADLELTYNDGNGLIKKENIQPGDVIGEKTFTVTNTGSITIDNYGVYLEEVINTFSIKEDVTYTLTCESSVENKTCNGVEKTTFPSLNERIVTNSIDKDETQTYKIKVEYAETGLDQSIDMNKRLEARVQIYNERDVVYLEGSVTGYSEGDYVVVESNPKKSQIVDGQYRVVGLKPDNHTIKVVGSDSSVKGTKNFSIVKGTEYNIADNTIKVTENTDSIMINLEVSSTGLKSEIIDSTISGGINKKNTLANVVYTNALNAVNEENTIRSVYSELPLTTPAYNVSTLSEKTLSVTQDDNGDSYYFRGNVVDNYVNYSGMCWRIVRIEGDGSVKLILDD